MITLIIIFILQDINWWTGVTLSQVTWPNSAQILWDTEFCNQTFL